MGLRGPTAWVHRAEWSLYAIQSGRSRASSPPAIPSGESGEHEHSGHVDGAAGDGYDVGYSSVIFVFGPAGQTVICTGGQSMANYAADFARLLEAA